MFNSIRHLIWDVDGTLYQNQSLAVALKKSFVRVVADKCGISASEAEEFLDANTAAGSHSWSQAVSTITGLPVKTVICEAEDGIDKSLFLRRDIRLIRLFQKISRSGRQQIILSNSPGKSISTVLRTVGLSECEVQFHHILSLDSLTHCKPHISCFEAVLALTHDTPESHLMVGDSIESDIIPAARLGMKTCLVHNGSRNDSADVSLNSVYQLSEIL